MKAKAKTKTPKTRKKSHNADQIIANLVSSKMNGENPKLTEWLIAAVKHDPDLRTIDVSFSGSGDSGEIQDITGFDSEGHYRRVHGDDTTFLYDLIEKHVSCDWVNNEGGGGSLNFDLRDLSMHVTSYYYAQTECDDKNIPLLS